MNIARACWWNLRHELAPHAKVPLVLVPEMAHAAPVTDDLPPNASGAGPRWIPSVIWLVTPTYTGQSETNLSTLPIQAV
jgi:hypothetical protein